MTRQVNRVSFEWIGTASVGALGIIATYRSGTQTRREQERLAALARRADAYVEVLTIAEHIGNWAQRVRPVLDTYPPRPPPPFPELDQQIRAQALLSASGTDEVRALLAAWRETVNAVSRADMLIGFELERRNEPRELRGEPPLLDGEDPWLALEQKLRPAEQAAREALGARINEELRPGLSRRSSIPWRR